MKRGWRGFILVAATVAMMSGCDRPAAPAPRPADDVAVQVKDDSAEGAARSALLLVRARLHAIAAGDRAARSAITERLVELADADEILRLARDLAQRMGLSDDEAVRQVVEAWGSKLSFYAEGLELDAMRPATPSETASRIGATLIVPAVAGGDRALVRVRVREERGVWRVAEIDFVPPAEGAVGAADGAPATAPAAMP